MMTSTGIRSDELYHYGVKGMKWGVRRARKNVITTPSSKKRRTESDRSDNQTTKKKGLSDKQKKAIKVGAAVAGTALAAYGTYKFSKWVNNQNVKLAAHTGQEFANRFSDQLRPKTMIMPGPAGHNRYAIGQASATQAGGKLTSLISEKVYSPKFNVRVKNAFEANKLSKGKKTVHDIFDYNKTVNEILKDEKVFNNGQTEFAKLVRDSINMGGSLPEELLK